MASRRRDAPRGDARASARRERGRDIRVTTTTFYRAESAQGRDLGVLAALTTRRRLEVLDATCASGARAARYAEADRIAAERRAERERLEREGKGNW